MQYFPSKAYDKCQEKQGAKIIQKTLCNGSSKINSDTKDLLISRTNSQSISQSEFINVQGYKSSIANLSVAQIENLLLKYASQNEKLSKQRHALFQKNCQLATQLKNSSGQQNNLNKKSTLFYYGTQNRNQSLSASKISGENFSLSNATGNQSKYKQQIKLVPNQQLDFQKKATKAYQPLGQLYLLKSAKQTKNSKEKQNNCSINQLITSPKYTNMPKNRQFQLHKKQKSQALQSGKTIANNVCYGNISQVKWTPKTTRINNNTTSLYMFDQEKTFIDKNSIKQDDEFQQNLLQPTFRQQSLSPISNKVNCQSFVKTAKFQKGRQNIKSNQSPTKYQNQASKKIIKCRNFMEIDMKIKKLKGQNKKLRNQIL